MKSYLFNRKTLENPILLAVAVLSILPKKLISPKTSLFVNFATIYLVLIRIIFIYPSNRKYSYY